MIVFTPPERPVLLGPLVFLAGPIQGAADWQARAIELLVSHVNVASPRTNRWEVGGITYEEQVDWETEHLNWAADSGGAILFWLAKENVHYCTRAYAQTTRFELGEWSAKYRLRQNFILAIGIEEGFTNAKYLRRRLAQDCPWLTIHSNLESTCQAALARL